MALEKFTVKISLGNEAMQTCDDVIDALEHVICDLRDSDFNNMWADSGSIMDINGNTVGIWKVR